LDFFSRGEQERRLGVHESVFESEILSKIRSRSRAEFALLAVASNTDIDPVDVMGHELLHAQFFLDARFRRVSLEFYRSLSRTTKNAVSTTLREHGYRTSEESHVANEVAAYLLQPAAQDHILGEYVQDCAGLLLDRFSDAGIAPVSVF
jgi:hypothetical protein